MRTAGLCFVLSGVSSGKVEGWRPESSEGVFIGVLGGRWRLLAGASVPVRISLCVAHFGLPQGLMARSQGWEWRVEKPHPFL